MSRLSVRDLIDSREGGIEFVQQMVMCAPEAHSDSLLDKIVQQISMAAADAGYTTAEINEVVLAFTDAAQAELQRLRPAIGAGAWGRA